jgi:heptosyltransferase-2
LKEELEKLPNSGSGSIKFGSIKMADKILIIQTAFLGDAILTLPMIQKLKELNPAFLIDVICIPSTKIIFEHSPHINKAIVLNKRGEHKSIFSLNRFARELKKNNYKSIYSPHRSFRSSLLTAMLKVKDAYGFDNSSFKFVYRNSIKYELNDHEVKRNLKLIGADTEANNWKILPEIIPTDIERNNVEKILNNFNNNKQIAIAPGSVWKTKQYPEENFIEIIEDCIKNSYSVILIGGREDSLLCERIKLKFHENVLSTAGKLNIIESIELLKRCDALICNDSAPTHMGMCADIPVITLYCSTVPGFGFYPYNEKSVSLGITDLYCKPCGIHGHDECPISTFECGLKLSPSLIFGTLQELIN